MGPLRLQATHITFWSFAQAGSPFIFFAGRTTKFFGLGCESEREQLASAANHFDRD